VPLARQLAPLGLGCDRRRLCQHDADQTARYRHRRWRTLCRGAGSGRALFGVGRQGCHHCALILRLGNRRAVNAVAEWGQRSRKRPRLCRRVVPLYRARSHRRHRHRRRGAAGQMRRARRHCQPSACRIRLPLDDAGHRPDRFLATRRGRTLARPQGVIIESANESRGDRPWVPHPRPARRPPAPI
jgi:hypothetical protein